ncbi:hypothetical protein [Psychrobacter lutiphocae]|uniref:hypothetical protein n=1 Tax=Psychrobacter lutiphocae TaxID=540500 RepID=UPI00036F1FCC|nr:hypothetical protein [Psychrobacter lutiphocae]
MKKIMQRAFILITLSLIVSFILFIINKHYLPPILGDLKLRYVSSNNYNLTYKGKTLAARVTAVDSWYIQKPYVYGSTTKVPSNKSYDLVYFFINVCSGERFITSDSSEFETFLDGKYIPDNKRNWMSGINAIDIQKAEYSSEIDCSKYN